MAFDEHGAAGGQRRQPGRGIEEGVSQPKIECMKYKYTCANTTADDEDVQVIAKMMRSDHIMHLILVLKQCKSRIGGSRGCRDLNSDTSQRG